MSSFHNLLSQLRCTKPTPADYNWAWAEAIVLSLNDQTSKRVRDLTKPDFCWLNATIEAQDWTLDFDKVCDLSTGETVATYANTSLEDFVNSPDGFLKPDDEPYRHTILSTLSKIITRDPLDLENDKPWEVVS